MNRFKNINVIDELYNEYDTVTKEGTNQKRLRWINGIFLISAFISFFGLIYDFITDFFFKAYFLPYLYNGIWMVFSIVFFFCTVLWQLERNRMYRHFNIELERPFYKIFQIKARDQYKELVKDKFEKKLIDDKLLYNNKQDIELILFFIKTIETYIKKTYKTPLFIAKKVPFIIVFITCFISIISFVSKEILKTERITPKDLFDPSLIKEVIICIILLAIIFAGVYFIFYMISMTYMIIVNHKQNKFSQINDILNTILLNRKLNNASCKSNSIIYRIRNLFNSSD